MKPPHSQTPSDGLAWCELWTRAAMTPAEREAMRREYEKEEK